MPARARVRLVAVEALPAAGIEPFALNPALDTAGIAQVFAADGIASIADILAPESAAALHALMRNREDWRQSLGRGYACRTRSHDARGNEPGATQAARQRSMPARGPVSSTATRRCECPMTRPNVSLSADPCRFRFVVVERARAAFPASCGRARRPRLRRCAGDSLCAGRLPHRA